MTDGMLWVFILCGIAFVVTMIYDMCFRCRHEWEQHSYSTTDNHNLNKITKVCLICKKCGKVKVLK